MRGYQVIIIFFQNRSKGMACKYGSALLTTNALMGHQQKNVHKYCIFHPSSMSTHAHFCQTLPLPLVDVQFTWSHFNSICSQYSQ